MAGGELKALRDRLRAASGSDRDLSTAINRALRQPDEDRIGTPERLANSSPQWGPHVTGSIDAAVALVERALAGWNWKTGDETNDGLGIWLSTHHDAPTAPLAILIALLEAMIGKDTGDA